MTDGRPVASSSAAAAPKRLLTLSLVNVIFSQSYLKKGEMV